jgi:hypothetical protein
VLDSLHDDEDRDDWRSCQWTCRKFADTPCGAHPVPRPYRIRQINGQPRGARRGGWNARSGWVAQASRASQLSTHFAPSCSRTAHQTRSFEELIDGACRANRDRIHGFAGRTRAQVPAGRSRPLPLAMGGADRAPAPVAFRSPGPARGGEPQSLPTSSLPPRWPAAERSPKGEVDRAPRPPPRPSWSTASARSTYGGRSTR